MIIFDDWTISARGAPIARQYDNLSRCLIVTGDIPDGWEWAMLVAYKDNLNILALEPMEGGIGVALTDDMIPYDGYYRLQLRGTRGEEIRHSNIVLTFIPQSLSGNAQWPTIPSEFTQLEERVQQAANQTQQSAQQAGQSAQAAQEAREAIENLGVSAESLPAGSPAAVTKTEQAGAVNLKFGIPAGTPGKDGQDGQTPALAIGTVITLEPGADATAEITGQTQNLTLNLGIPQGHPGQDAPQIDDEAVTGTNPWSSKRILDTLCPAFEVEGNPVTCTPVEGYPLGVQVSWEPTQEGEGDPSPDNVRPISGWDAANLWVGGENLWKGPSGYTVAENSHYANYADAETVAAVNALPRGVPLYFSASWDYSSDGTEFVWLGSVFSQPQLRIKNNTEITIPQGAVYDAIRVYAGGNKTQDATVTDFMFSAGASTTYTPYNPASRTITLPFGQTVYGGTLDAVTGVGSEDFGFISLNGTEDWIPQGSQMRSAFQVQSPAPDYTGICSHFAYLGNFSGNCLFVHTNRYIYIGSALFAQYNNDVEQWKSYLVSQAAAGTPVQVCYKLATPQPIQATGGQTIPALSGTNTIYTDGDSVTVSGRADSLATIQAMQEQIAALTQHIAEGGTV